MNALANPGASNAAVAIQKKNRRTGRDAEPTPGPVMSSKASVASETAAARASESSVGSTMLMRRSAEPWIAS